MSIKKNKLLTNFSFFQIATFVVWGGFFVAYWSQAYTLKNGHVFAQSLGTWADGAAHLTYTSALAFQPNFPTSLPVYLGTPFIYPFAADSISAIFLKLGFDIFSAYSIVGLVLSIILIFALNKFYFLFTKNTNASALATNLFLLGGGLGFIKFIQDAIKQGPAILSKIPKEYTRLDADNIWWLNIITGELIPQRAMLLGIPIGLVILINLYKIILGKTLPNQHMFLTGLAIGLLPFIHPHTLIALLPVISWIFSINVTKKNLFNWLHLLVPAVVITTLLAYFISTNTTHDIIKYYPGWLAKTNNINWFWFWFSNWGLFPVIAVMGWFTITTNQKLFVTPFILLFVLSNLFLFQPYDWDNSKLLTWVYLVLAPVVSLFLIKMHSSHPKLKPVVIFILITLTFSGTIDIIRQLQPHTKVHMYTPEELALAQNVKTRTSPNSIFLTSDLHTHFLPTLTGRQIIMGYRGWLWTYGIDYQAREKQVTSIYQGSPNAQNLISQLNIDYIIIGSPEKDRLKINTAFFEKNYPKLVQTQNYTIYQIN